MFAVISVVSGLLGVGVLVAAYSAESPADAVIVEVDDERTTDRPVTVAPVDTASAPTPATQPSQAPAPANPATANPATTRPPSAATSIAFDDAESLSPLTELLGSTYSAIPEPSAPRPRPSGLAIDSIDVGSYPIREVGLEADGQLEIPSETEIGWYKYGATAGQPGATVLAAHVSWNDTVGPFFELGSLEPGARISVALDDGTSREYEVVERTMYDKTELPRERIWRNTGPETLVLITCGGDFNPEIRRYRQNIVVYAVPVG